MNDANVSPSRTFRWIWIIAIHDVNDVNSLRAGV